MLYHNIRIAYDIEFKYYSASPIHDDGKSLQLFRKEVVF
jgi:hypothetical protein